MVDTIEKEYYCLSCSTRIVVKKDKYGNFTKIVNDGRNPKITYWKTL